MMNLTIKKNQPMEHVINPKKYKLIQRKAFEIAAAAGCSIDQIMQKNNGEFHIFLRVLLTKVAMEHNVKPYQVSLFLRKSPSTALYYENMYLIFKHVPKFKALEEKYYEMYGPDSN